MPSRPVRDMKHGKQYQKENREQLNAYSREYRKRRKENGCYEKTDDVREKLVELLDLFVYDDWYSNGDIAEKLIANGVTVQEMDGCEYCNEDSEGYRKMLGAFSITNPFHGSVWNIETCHCKPRQIYFCPMCGRKLLQPPKGE